MWPVWGNVARLVAAGLGCWLAMRAGHGLTGVFVAQATALVVDGLLNSYAIMAACGSGRCAGRPRLGSSEIGKDAAMLAR